MKSPYVNELEASKVFTATFLVHSKEIRQKKSGEPYLSLQLGDRTGDIEAKMWDNVADVMNTFDRDDFVRVKGLVQVYNNRLQLTIHKMQRVDERDVDLGDYFPASARDPGEMMAELRQIVASMSNPHLRSLVESFLDDPEIGPRYQKAPAAKIIHHAYLGGLLEHVLSLCNACRLMVSHYQTLDLDLLVTGAVLHDVGKIYELSYERGFGYSTEGQLLGHIAIALRLIERKISLLSGFPEHLRSLVEHLVLSHHGQLEFGSPKVPLFPEALVLHYLDDLDAKMECMRALVEQDRQLDGHWTGYSAPLERVVLKKLKYLADHEREDAGVAQPDPRPPLDPQPPCEPLPPRHPALVRENLMARERPVPEPSLAAPTAAARRPEPPRREARTPSLFGEKLGQAFQALREDK